MRKNPWAYVPTLYLAEGFPYVIINTVSVLLYAQLGYPNKQITLWTSWLYLPWVLKMFWSPFVDANFTKRRWLIGAQTAMSAVLLCIAGLICWHGLFAAPNPHWGFFTFSLLGFLVGAFVSATLDIATDGYYLLALTPQQQGYFVGIRTIFYRIAMILGSGLLVSAAGYLSTHGIPAPYHWCIFFGTLAVFFAGCALYHTAILPKPLEDKPSQTRQTTAWKEAFTGYFKQENILYILLFILLYRFGEALLEKIVPLFLVKPVADGALGISMQDYGLIKGTLGLGAIIIGNLLGGWLLGRFGFKKCIWPFAIALVLPNIFYVYLASARPGLGTLALLLTLENFGYGLAMMALTVFIMYVSQGKYKTSHYAISTGIMALGMMVPSMLSGKMQTVLGYKNFFWVAFLISLVTFAIVPLCFKIKAIDIAEKAQKDTK